MHRVTSSQDGEGDGEDTSRMKRWRAERKASQTRNAQYVKSLLDRAKGVDKRAIFAGEEELRKLKLGLQAETRKWRAHAVRSMKAQNQKYLFSDTSDTQEELDRAEIVSRGLNELEDSPERFRPLSLSADTSEENRRVEADQDGSGVGKVSVSELQIQRQRQKATGGRWRASLELIDSAATAGQERDKDKDRDAEILSPSKRDGGKGDRSKSDRSASKSGGKVSSGEDRVSRDLSAEKGAGSGVTPNYALLIHSCLLLSLSTYNLKVINYPSLLTRSRTSYLIPSFPILSCIFIFCQRRSYPGIGLTSISAARKRCRE